MVQSLKKTVKEKPCDAAANLYVVASVPSWGSSDKTSFSRFFALRASAEHEQGLLEAAYKLIDEKVSTKVIEIYLFE